jgi:hypothetical protein
MVRALIAVARVSMQREGKGGSAARRAIPEAMVERRIGPRRSVNRPELVAVGVDGAIRSSGTSGGWLVARQSWE